MPIAKPYPADCFGWLFVDGPEAQRALDQKLRLVKAAEANNPDHTGEPEGFSDWALQHVAGLAGMPVIARQIQQRRMDLHRQQGELERRMANVVCALEAEAARIDDDLRVLDQLEAGA